MDIFSLVYHFSFLSPSLWETARYKLKYCLKGPLSQKQPTLDCMHFFSLLGLFAPHPPVIAPPSSFKKQTQHYNLRSIANFDDDINLNAKTAIRFRIHSVISYFACLRVLLLLFILPSYFCLFSISVLLICYIYTVELQWPEH